MRPDRIRAHLRKQPFQPIRVFVSDGSYYDVGHPELMLVARTGVVIALASGDDRIPDIVADLDPMHVTRIEPIDGKKPKAKKRRGE